jgi:hypothetical protein
MAVMDMRQHAVKRIRAPPVAVNENVARRR